VHCDQPVTFNAASGDHGTLAPATDAGLQIGWDDEQVTAWHNRQLDIARARQAAVDPPAEVPLGVLGYRLDVSENDGATWESLCLATQQFSFGPLQGPQQFEAAVEPTPVRANRPDDNRPWLPRYFALWRGGSLVADDPVTHEVTGGGVPPPESSLRPWLPSATLRYGGHYGLRVRLADLTGGGPSAGETPTHPGAASVAKWTFLRHVPPKAVRVTTSPGRPPMPSAGQAPAPPPPTTLTSFEVLRPLIGYPEMRFAGLSDADLARFRTQIAGGPTQVAGEPGQVFGIPDPDVDTLHITVEARSLAHDEGGTPPLDGAYRVLYECERPFPPRPADPLAEDAPVQIQLDYTDADSVSSLSAPATGLSLPVPTARDVRIRLVGICRAGNYFGSPAARSGITVDLTTRREAAAEDGLLVPVGAHGLEAVLLHPGADAAERLAQQVGLAVSGLDFSGRPGTRTVMAASKFLRHTVSGDFSSLTLANRDELLQHWVVVVRFDLARDWTWDGLADEGITVERSDAGEIGRIQVPRTAPASALAAGDESQRRELTHLVFLDAVSPQPAAGEFPSEITVSYRLRPALTGKAAAKVAEPPELRLPVAANPAQIPRLASAGIALSPYVAADDYSSTEPRRRALWIELGEPVADPADGLFARVLAYAPDPLLDPSVRLPDIADRPPLAVPDEAIRVIAPGQSRDDAGLAAMTRLTPAVGSNRHFLLPLPEGVDASSPLLFGLWTYELRVGHADEWSTAQARFGRPLQVSGVQHPAPTLSCAAGRIAPDPKGILVTAPLATSVAADGKRLGAPGRNLTSMHFLLYAQARQADRLAWRNILLLTQAETRPAPPIRKPPTARDYVTLTFFAERSVTAALQALRLPLDSPLSVIAVEMMPQGTDPRAAPLSDNLGYVRILRTSPLTPVRDVCPPDTQPLPQPILHPGLPVVVENQAPP
jgi:hypothetical protein